MIRADLNLLADPNCRPWGERSCAAPEARQSEAERDENPGKASLFAAGADPVLGAGERKGRGGRSTVRRRRRPRAARRLPAPRPARAGALRAPPGASERRRLRQDPAPQRRRRRAARPALRRRRRARARRETSDALARPRRPAAQPRPRPDRDAAARLDLALPDPNGLASSLKACQGRAIRSLRPQRPLPWRSPPSRTPQRPKPKSSRSGCSTSSSPSGCAGRGPCR